MYVHWIGVPIQMTANFASHFEMPLSSVSPGEQIDKILTNTANETAAHLSNLFDFVKIF